MLKKWINMKNYKKLIYKMYYINILYNYRLQISLANIFTLV